MKIIFFSSHTATWFFAIAEAVIAHALQKRGHNVLFITPGNMFAEISNVKQEQILRQEFDLRGYEIGAILTTDDLKKTSSIMKTLNNKNFGKLEIDGIQIGKIALYEFLLHHKKMDAKLTKKEWRLCRTEIKNTLLSFYACRRIIKREKPDRILVYNALYSVNHVWEKYASRTGIPVYFLHHGVNFSDIDNTLIIAKKNTFYFIKTLRKIWSNIKEVSVNRKALGYVTNHFLELLKAKHYLVYSTPQSKQKISVRKMFNVEEGQKLMVATMSSYDEMFAAEYVGEWKMPKNLIFVDQTQWIKSLINYVKNKKDKFLIIRVHPREFPNKRDGVKSEHAKMLEKVLKDLPDNVRINWPADKLSIYDLAHEADAFLNAWSTVGIEMSLLGIPVVLYSKDLTLYPSDLNYVAKNRKEYFEKIEIALKEGWSYEKIIKTYRWLALSYYQTIMRFRYIRSEPKASITRKSLWNIANYVYGLIPAGFRQVLIKIYFTLPGLGVGRRQREECRRQLKEKVNISNVERMLLTTGDSLVDIKTVSKSNTGRDKEDFYIRNELKRIYNAMFVGTQSKSKIKKDSLQGNLKQLFF